MTDIGLTKATAAIAEAVPTGPRPSTGAPTFEPDDFDHTPYFDSLGAAFSDSGVITGAVRAAKQSGNRAELEVDPNYDLQLDLESRPDDLAFVNKFLTNPSDPRNGSFLHELVDSRSAAHTAQIISRTREAEKRQKLMEANPSAAFFGTVGSIGLDIAAAMATLPEGGLPIVVGGRALAALRTARLGAIEAGAERAVQSATNPLIAPTDIVEAAGLGVLFGGALGAAAPSLVGNVRRLADDVLEPRRLTDDVVDDARRATGRAPESTAGAAQVDDMVVPAKGSGSLVARKISPKWLQRAALRNLKRIIVDIGAEGNRAWTAVGRVGGRRWFDVMARAVRLSTVMADEVAGGAARRDSVQDLVNEYRAMRSAREAQSKSLYDETAKSLYGAGMWTLYRRNSPLPLIGRSVESKVSQEQFEAMADELAQLRARNASREPAGALPEERVIPEEIAQSHTTEQIETIIRALDTHVAQENEFYRKLGELEVRHGLIKPEDLIDGYRPQRWDNEAIQMDVPGFKAFLTEVFRREPDAEWIRANYLRPSALPAGDDALDEILLDAGFTVDEVRRAKLPPDDPMSLDPAKIREAQQGYAYVGGTWRKVTQDDIDGFEIAAADRRAEWQERLDAYTGEPWEGEGDVQWIFGSDHPPMTWANMLKKVSGETLTTEDRIADKYRRQLIRSQNKSHLEPVLKDGETWFDLQKRNPVLAEEIMTDWTAALKENALRQREAAQAVVDDELARLRGDTAEDVRQTFSERHARLEQQIIRLEARAAQAADESERVVLAGRIAAKERDLADVFSRIQALRRAANNVDQLDEFLKRYASNAARKALREARGQAAKAASRAAAAEARKTVDEQIDKIVEDILSDNNPWGFASDELIQTSSRFKRRSINLGSFRHTPEARRFLLTNTHDARAAYETSTGVQIAMRETYGSDFNIATLRQRALSGYDEDMIRAADDKAKKAIMRERDEAEKLFDRVFEELTHDDVAKLKGWRQTASSGASIVNTGMAAISLGGVALAQLGDMAVQMMAGGRLSTGFQFAWRGQMRKHLAEIAKDDAETAVILQGVSVLDASRFRAIADIDSLGFDVPGGKFRQILRSTSEVAKIEGWANLMHVWNRIVRGGFGMDFARQIDKDMANYAKLPASLKTFYAKLGIDEKVARDMADLMERHHSKYVNGKLRLPDAAKWGAERPELLARYRRAIQAAGDEAMIDPSVADRPFLRGSAAGRMILQFQSFMFTAGERFIAPMLQEMRLHPTSMRPYFAAFMGLYLGAMTDGLKSAVRGEFQDWYERWDTSEGFRDNLWGALLRSPMMAGSSSILTDVALSSFGRSINDLSEGVTGVRPLRAESSKFKEKQGFAALFGPAAGFFAGTVPAMGNRLMDGELDEAWDMASRRIPVLNVFYLHLLGQLGE